MWAPFPDVLCWVVLSWGVHVSVVRCGCGFSKDEASPVEERARLPSTWSVFRGRSLLFAELLYWGRVILDGVFGVKSSVARIE